MIWWMVVQCFGSRTSKSSFQCIINHYNIICIVFSQLIQFHNYHFRFRLIDKENIEFKQFGLRDNVAQLSVFEVHHLLPEVRNSSSQYMLIPLFLSIC